MKTMMNNDTKECPFCAETIKAKAIVCRYCGRDLPISVAIAASVVEVIEENKTPTPLSKANEPKTEPRKSRRIRNIVKPQKSSMSKQIALVVGLIILSCCMIMGLNYLFIQPTSNKIVYVTPTEKRNWVSTVAVSSDPLEKIMKKHSVVLTAREVQYDMANNLDYPFGLSGDAELSDYYNWGFDDKNIKTDFFCVEVTPFNGNFKDRWYIYFSRSSASELYQDLLKGNVKIFMVAKVPSYIYDKNQGNMAFGVDVIWQP